MNTHFHVIIVGAGPGGLAVAAALKKRGVTEFVILEKGTVGQSWLEYPSDTHLLSTSSPGIDHNMIADVPSFAVNPNVEHPSHLVYQKYLEAVAQKLALPIQESTTVVRVSYSHEMKKFVVQTKDEKMLTADAVVWAAGMYDTPNTDLDAEGCYVHYAQLPYLDNITSPAVTVVGSANGASGVVLELAKPGRVVTLVTSHEYTIPEPIDCLWKEQMVLIKHMVNQGLVKIVENFRVKRIYKEASEQEMYILEGEDGQTVTAPKKPILCTGFQPNIEAVKELVNTVCREKEEFLNLDESYQSHLQPGFYVAGVLGKRQHDDGMIIKFREFGPVIAESIAKQM